LLVHASGVFILICDFSFEVIMRLFGRMLTSALLFVPGLWAQVRLTLADAISQALAGNPQIVTAEARVGVAEGLRRQAGLAPNPRLTLQSENGRFWGSPPFSYSPDADSLALLSQTFETGGKRKRRVEAATAGVQRSRLEQELFRRQVVSRVSTAYWIAAGAARTRDLFQQETANFERVIEYNRNRTKEGAAPEVDLLRIEVERDRLTTSARIAAEDAERSTIALFREMGKPDFPNVEFADSVEQIRPVAIIAPDRVLEQRPAMQVARKAIDEARANLRLEEANAKPDPDIEVGYKRTAAVGASSVRGIAVDTLYGSIQIPLPIRNRNQGRIDASVSGIRAAESTLASTETLVRSEVATARRDYESRKQLLDQTLRPMRDRADEVYRISDAAYREGGTDILRLLDAERSRIDTQLLYIRTLTDYQLSAVALQTAEGILP
jgi:cobalt-zinc-cadmium efflux system outer membrane protein